MTVFERCKSIPAFAVAEAEGLPLTKRGARYWAHCHFHADRTPSLVFVADGCFKCVSCGTGGDAVAFYSRLKGVPPIVAATQLAKEWPHASARLAVQETTRDKSTEAWRREKQLDLLDVREAADAAMKRRATVLAPEQLMDDDRFTTALAAYWWAEDALRMLDSLTSEMLYGMDVIS